MSYELQNPVEYSKIVNDLLKSNKTINEFINKNSEFSCDKFDKFNYINALCKSFSYPYATARDYLSIMLAEYYNDNAVVKSIIYSYLMLRAPQKEVLLMFNFIINNSFEPSEFVFDIINECNPAVYKYYLFKKFIFTNKLVLCKFISLLVKFIDNFFNILLYAIQKNKEASLVNRILCKNNIIKYLYIILFLRNYHANFYENLAINLLKLPESVIYQNQKNTTKSKKIVIWSVCYGEEYFEKMIKYNLPSQLTPKNIPQISGEANIEYLFYTDKAGKDKIASQKIFFRLSRYASIKIIMIDSLLKSFYKLDEDYHFIILSLCTFHNYLILRNKDIYVISNSPDMIVCNNFFEELFKIKDRGNDCICAFTNLRSSKNGVLNELEKYNYLYDIDIPESILYKIKINNIHLSMVNKYWSSDLHYKHSGILIHDIENEALICYSTALHPLMIKYKTCNYYYLGTIDHIVPVSIFNFNLYIINNTNLLCMLTLEDDDSDLSSDRVGPYIRDDFIKQFSNTMFLKNRLFFSICIKFIFGKNINKEIIIKEIKKYDELILSLLNHVDKFDDSKIIEHDLHARLLNEKHKIYEKKYWRGDNNYE